MNPRNLKVAWCFLLLLIMLGCAERISPSIECQRIKDIVHREITEGDEKAKALSLFKKNEWNVTLDTKLSTVGKRFDIKVDKNGLILHSVLLVIYFDESQKITRIYIGDSYRG